MADTVMDRHDDPALNDDSQPSVTSSEDVLRQASENAGVPPSENVIPYPADALDMEYRKQQADESAEEAIANLEAGNPSSPVTTSSGGTFSEANTLAELQAEAEARGLPSYGTKADILERLNA